MPHYNLMSLTSSSTYFLSFLTMNEEPSAYWETFVVLPPPMRIIPHYLPFITTFLTMCTQGPLNHKIKNNIRGKKSTMPNSCQAPMSVLKFYPRLPLSLTKMHALPKSNVTWQINCFWKPIFFIVWRKICTWDFIIGLWKIKWRECYVLSRNLNLEKSFLGQHNVVQARPYKKNLVCSCPLTSLSIAWTLPTVF